jgi:hemerythrin-like domain-containing protein
MVTEPLREEHQELAPRIEQIRRVADAVGQTPVRILLRNIDKIDDFYVNYLLPHAFAEEVVLYVTIGKILATPQAIATMSFDHAEINRFATQLRGLRPKRTNGRFSAGKVNNLPRVLHGLYTLVKVHLAKEEEIFFRC